MSAQSLTNFCQQLPGNSALQISMAEAIKSGPQAVIALGAAHGCSFDAADIQAAVSGTNLTDFELELVAGGGKHGSWGAELSPAEEAENLAIFTAERAASYAASQRQYEASVVARGGKR